MQEWIPKFMVVSGAIALLLQSCVFCVIISPYYTNERAVLRIPKTLAVVLSLFYVIILTCSLAGIILVFKDWRNLDKDNQQECHKDNYLLAFSFLIIIWCLVGIAVPLSILDCKKNRSRLNSIAWDSPESLDEDGRG